MHVFRWLGVALLLCLVGCASSQPKNNFELAIGEDEISMELSRQMVLDLLADRLDSSIECGGGDPGELHALLSPLANRRRGTASLRRGDERITASRRGSRLSITVEQGRAERLEVILSWSFAECVLGERTALSDALSSAPITLVYLTDDGKRIKASVR